MILHDECVMEEEGMRAHESRTNPWRISDLEKRSPEWRPTEGQTMSPQMRKRCCMARRSRGGECSEVPRSNRITPK